MGTCHSGNVEEMVGDHPSLERGKFQRDVNCKNTVKRRRGCRTADFESDEFSRSLFAGIRDERQIQWFLPNTIRQSPEKFALLAVYLAVKADEQYCDNREPHELEIWV